MPEYELSDVPRTEARSLTIGDAVGFLVLMASAVLSFVGVNRDKPRLEAVA